MLRSIPLKQSNRLVSSILPKRLNHTGVTKSQAKQPNSDIGEGINNVTNEDIVEKLKSLRFVSVDESKEIKSLLNKPLTEKELELDEELTKFFEEFKHSQAKATTTDATTTSHSISTVPFPFLKSITKPEESYSPQELYLRQLNHAKTTASLGAKIKDTYQPHQDTTSPPSIEETTIQKLMAANVHLGQSVPLYRPSTQQFIYGEYNGLHIIDLNQTLQYLKRACSVVEGVAENGGLILILGTRPQWKVSLQAAARRMNGYFVSTRWIPGTLTNPTELSRIWSKQEIDQNDVPTGRTLTNDEMSCIVKPDLLIVLNPTENRNALYEAMKTRVPTIGIIDTDSEPSLVTYPIPGNDDSNRSVNLLLGILSKAGERGLNKRLKQSSTERTI